MMYGSDIEALRRLGETLRQNAEALESQVTVIGAQVQGVPWFGPSGGMFEDEWVSLHLPGMRAAALGLRAAGEAAIRNADAQETTSSDLGSAGSAPVAGGGSDDSTSTGSGSTGGSPLALVQTDGDSEPPGKGPVPLENRKPTSEILREYQVALDEMYKNEDGERGWKPSGWDFDLADWLDGGVDLDTEEPVRITVKEAEMLDEMGPLELSIFNEIRTSSSSEADERFPRAPREGDHGGRQDNHNDAFRHAYWNAMMAGRYGQDWAHDYGTAHEQTPGNEAPAREAMDLYNNEVGRRIQAEHPDVTPEQLAGFVEQAVRDGEMVVIGPDGQSLVYSDQIAPGATGVAKRADPIPGHQPEWRSES